MSYFCFPKKTLKIFCAIKLKNTFVNRMTVNNALLEQIIVFKSQTTSAQ